MAVNLTIWDHATSLKLPDGKTYSKEEIEAKYPIQADGVTVLEWVSTNIVGGIDNLETLKNVFSIDSALSDEAALAAIIEVKTNPLEADPTAEERIAAALEYQNLTSL